MSNIIALNPLTCPEDSHVINKNPIENSVKGLHLVSNKFAHITTREIVTQLESRGFQLLNTRVSKALKPENEGYQKHLLSFTHQGLDLGDGLKGTVMVRNGNAGNSALTLFVGLFRLLCENQLIAGNGFFGAHIYHKGNPIPLIHDGLDRMFSQAARLKDVVDAMRARQLSTDECLEFREKAAQIRLADIPLIQHIDYRSFNPVREGDLGRDLFTVFNRYQERVIRGGIRYVQGKTDDNGNVVDFHNGTTRASKSIPTNVKLNTQLWDLAQGYLGKAA